MTAPRMDGPAWAMLLLLAVLWGGSFVLTEVILADLPVVTTVAIRVAVAALTLLAVVLAMGTPIPRSPKLWGAFLVMGTFANAVPFSLIVWGQTHLTGGLAAVLNATTPIVTGILAGIVLPDERLTRHKLLGLLLGLVGVAAVIGPSALQVGGDVLAELAALGAACCYALATVYARRFARLGVPPTVVALGQTTTASILVIPFALVHDAPWTLAMPSAGVIAALIAFGCLSTALAYILFYAILARAGTNVVLVTVLVPAVAVALGAATLGEPVSTGQLVGMGLIAFGLAVVDGRLWRRFAPARPAPQP